MEGRRCILISGDVSDGEFCYGSRLCMRPPDREYVRIRFGSDGIVLLNVPQWQVLVQTSCPHFSCPPLSVFTSSSSFDPASPPTARA
jgi:hypothetical protein